MARAPWPFGPNCATVVTLRGGDGRYSDLVDVEVIDSHEALQAMAGEWQALATAAGASPFSMPFWALAWWEHLGRGGLHVVTVRDKGRLVALAPLHRRPRVGGSVLRFLGHGLGAVSSVLVAPGEDEAGELVWSTLLADRRAFVDLVEYRDGGPGLLALRRRPAGSRVVTLRDMCPAIDMTGSL